MLSLAKQEAKLSLG